MARKALRADRRAFVFIAAADKPTLGGWGYHNIKKNYLDRRRTIKRQKGGRWSVWDSNPTALTVEVRQATWHAPPFLAKKTPLSPERAERSGAGGVFLMFLRGLVFALVAAARTGQDYGLYRLEVYPAERHGGKSRRATPK